MRKCVCLFPCQCSPHGIFPAAACMSDRLLSRCFPLAVFLYLFHLCSLSEKVYPVGPIWAPGPPRPLHSQSSYTPEPLRLPAILQGIPPRTPRPPQTVKQQLCTRQLARREVGGSCLGIKLTTCFTKHTNITWQRLLLEHHCFCMRASL